MTLDKALDRFREFHLKEPNRIVKIPTEIPQIVHPIGFCPQISYISNKWNKDEQWHRYIHWWEGPTLVCVPKHMIDDIETEFENGFYSDQEINLGRDRDEVTFLGYAIDFNLSGDDRSKIRVNPATSILGINPTGNGESERLEGTYTFNFNDNPKTSKDYVVCSPNGRIVYVIADNGKEIYVFVNSNCKVTKHGIEG